MEGNLQSRLEAARNARLRPPPVIVDPQPRPERHVIDLITLRRLRDAGRRALAERVQQAPEPEDLRFDIDLGRHDLVGHDGPTAQAMAQSFRERRCPACGGRTRVDLIDLVEGVAHMTCVGCGLLHTARPRHSELADNL